MFDIGEKDETMNGEMIVKDEPGKKGKRMRK